MTGMSSPALGSRTPSSDGTSDIVSFAKRAYEAATAACEAASKDSKTSEHVKKLVSDAAEAAKLMLSETEMVAALPMKRQTFEEFTTLLSDEVKEASQACLDEGVRYAERQLRKTKSIIEDHFMIDEAFRMLGPLRQDSNRARDCHDWFNLIALVPVVVFNLSNWSCLSPRCLGLFTGGTALPSLWHGEAFQTFWWMTALYFVSDILWVMILPDCVRSPRVIMQHHFVTLAYIMLPKLRNQYGWIMGACMIVEINTWFLIARRSFNKKGDKMFTTGVPLAKSLRLLLVSGCFYSTWFLIRLVFYPYLLIVVIGEWWSESQRLGTPLNLIAIAPIMQLVFIFLNMKWTIDLIRSKLKGRGPGKGL